MLQRIFSIATAWLRSNADLSAGNGEKCVQRIQALRKKAGRHSWRPAHPVFFRFIVLTAMTASLGCPPAGLAAVPAGTEIINTARASYLIGGARFSRDSNLVQVVTVIPRTPSAIEFLRYAPTLSTAMPIMVRTTAYSDTGQANGPFIRIAPPTPLGASGPLPLDTPHPLSATQIYHAAEPLFIRLTDLDQNTSAIASETALVAVTSSQTGDNELLRLRETAADSGVFVGYLPTTAQMATLANGILSVQTGESIAVRYQDQADATDRSSDTAIIDPYGRVFDSSDGTPVDGVRLRLVDATTGAAATVYADDGVTPVSAEVVTGDVATGLPAGAFRFPFVPQGHYRLQVIPPAAFLAPSLVPNEQLQTLNGAPYVIETGSRGESFELNPGPNLWLDIPVDRTGGGLWLQKQAGKEVAGIGDFIPYQLRIENNDPLRAAPGVAITDTLPLEFRYRSGSTQIDGIAAADPVVAPDGRTLIFNLGDIPPETSRVVSYVTEVGIQATPGEKLNTAVATPAAGDPSNVATAAVKIREELIHSRSFLVGRVLIGECDQDEASRTGLKGVRIYLEDGTYTVTDADGNYHFEGVSPERHVVQLDLDSLPAMYEILACEDNTRFAGRAYSQLVDIQRGTLWRADFHVGLRPRAQGTVSLAMRGTVDGESASFQLPVEIGDVPLGNVRLTVIAPQNLAYLPGSTLLDGQPLDDPTTSGTALTFRLGNRPAAWQGNLTFKGRITAANDEDLPMRAILTFDTPTVRNQRTDMVDTLLYVKRRETVEPLPTLTVRPHFPTFVATLSQDDKAMLDEIIKQLIPLRVKRVHAIGHSDNVRIAPRSRAIFADNYALSAARAHSVARYIGDALGLAPEMVSAEGVADTRPIASNATTQGKSLNRRVELHIDVEKVDYAVSYGIHKEQSEVTSRATEGLRPGELPPQPAVSSEEPDKMPSFDQQWLDQTAPGSEWLWPPPEEVPAIPSIVVAIKHHPEEKPDLLVNGAEVEPISFEGTRKNQAGTVAVSIWRGVIIQDGDNRMEVVLKGPHDEETRRIVQNLHHSTAPVRAELVPEESTLVADGKSPSVIAVRLFDKDGYPACAGVVGNFRLSPPYSPGYQEEREIESLAQSQSKFKVGPKGLTKILIAPTSRSGEVILHLAVEDKNEEIRAWLKPQPRDWILVGIAEGTAGYNSVNGNLESLTVSDAEDNYYQDGRVAFFAKGKIKGSWLLTMAYDSHKKRQDSLHQTIDPDAYYTLYGDATTQGYEAASARKLFVKLEREHFYALFGDYETGLTVTELSRYNRSLNGIKSEYQGEMLNWNVFAAESNQSFVKDEIQGNGTSGLYRLSRTNIVINSEKISLETRDRFHRTTVISSRTLSRHLDYNIDYELGTIYFKEPIASRDQNFNPIFIVIDYESLGTGSEAVNYGGRGALKLFGGRLETGVSMIHEGVEGADGDLLGADLTLQLSKETTFKGEVATSKIASPNGNSNGDAYLAEVTHEGPRFIGRAYVKEEQTGFGLGQQSFNDTGSRTAGVEGDYLFTPDVTVSGQISRQTDFSTRTVQDLGEAAVAYQMKNYKVSGGIRHARDRDSSGAIDESSQGLVALGWQVTPRLSLRASHDQSLAGSNNSLLYPTRTRLGADYRLTEQASLFGEQEWTDSSKYGATQWTRGGIKTSPWSGAEAESSLGQQITEAGERIFANLGLKQTWRINPQLNVDAGIDRSQTLSSGITTESPVSPDPTLGTDPSAVGQVDFTALSVGANWLEKTWSWFSRAEYLTSAQEDKWSLSAGAMGEVRKGIGLSAESLFFLTDADDGSESSNGQIRLGWAWRPTESRWIVYDRLDFLVDRQTGSTTSDYSNWRIIDNLHANLKLNRQTQIALQYGLKYVQENIDGDDYAGFTDLIGLEGRYDLTKSWDLGLRGNVLHGWNSGQLAFSAGPSIGCRIMTNAWLSVGYNLTGFDDRDFSAADFTAQGPYVRFRFKFDQYSVKEALELF